MRAVFLGQFVINVAHAGLKERTFFRHFLDKREILLEAQAVLVTALTGSIDDVSAGLGPVDVLFRTLRSLGRLLAVLARVVP